MTYLSNEVGNTQLQLYSTTLLPYSVERSAHSEKPQVEKNLENDHGSRMFPWNLWNFMIKDFETLDQSNQSIKPHRSITNHPLRLLFRWDQAPAVSMF